MAAATAALDRFTARVGALYSLPAVAVKLIELTAQPHVDLRSLKDCIENDPALAAKVLRVVNSSLFGLGREVRDLNQALALLGIKPLKLLVLGFSLSEAFSGTVCGAAVDRYWRHALTRAVAARELSQQVWNLPGDEAFLAALLQDIGVLVLLSELGAPYARFLERTAETERDPAPLEKSVFTFDRHDLAARLLGQWHLPSALVGAILSAQNPDDLDRLPPGEQVLPRILRSAQHLVDLVVDHRLQALERLYHEPAARGPLSVAQVELLVGELESRVEQLAGAFACELPPGVDYRDVLVEAHRQMSRLTSEMTGDMLRKAALADEAPSEENLLAEVEDLATAMARIADRTGAPPSQPLSLRERPGEGNYDVRPGEGPKAASQPLSARSGEGPKTADQPLSLRERLGEGIIRPLLGEPAASAEASAAPLSMPAASGRGAARLAEAALVPASVETLAERLDVALTACQRQRLPLSVVLVAVDRFEQFAALVGPIVAEQAVHRIDRLCRACDAPGAETVQVDRACFALVLPDCDRREAVTQADHLLAQFRSRAGEHAAAGAPLTASVGAATAVSPAKNFRSSDLIASAMRCLSTARLSGGNALKSIGVY